VNPLLLQSRAAVGTSDDLQRVLRLARRPPVDLPPSSPRAAALGELMTERLRRRDRPRGSACGCRAMGRASCIDSLLPAQAWALYEAPIVGGLLAPIGVGAGKTGLDILMACVMPTQPRRHTVALLVPPGLVEQLIGDYHAWGEHFEVPSLVVVGSKGTAERGWYNPRPLPDGRPRPAVHVIPYSRLSHESSTALLEQLDPVGILGDEIHNLKSADSVRTGRFLRHFLARPDTWLCGWSGTIATDSIKNFAHLAALMLGNGSPLPLDPDVVTCWATAIDPSDWPVSPGALMALARPGETVQEAVGRRVRETPGVVSTTGPLGVAASIAVMDRKPPPMPSAMAEKIADLRETWTRPDGEELVQALDVSKCAREMACGFFYKWRFPGNPPRELIDRWFAARKAWHRELRDKLKDARPHMDSPLLCARAAIRAYDGKEHDPELPVWHAETWLEWVAVRDTISHVTEAVWVDDWLARDAAEWARKNVGIVWYEHDAFGKRVSELSGLPLFHGGPGDKERFKAHAATGRSAVASIVAHGTGTDGLQFHYSNQLVANPPPSGALWEQLLGRAHRLGQRADVVSTWVYRHTPEMREACDRAFIKAKFLEGLLTQTQRLLVADCDFALS